jgi:biopolymer transport protein TolR
MAVNRRIMDPEELNLTPIMNLITILIPFLVMSAQFVQLAVIDSTLPAIGPPQPTEEEPDKPPLNLSLALTSAGITILGADAVLHPGGAPVAEGEGRPPTIPCPGGRCERANEYGWAALTTELEKIKDEYPDEANVILVPDGNVEYEVLVRAMDASRDNRYKSQLAKQKGGEARELFPYVVIAGGAVQ